MLPLSALQKSFSVAHCIGLRWVPARKLPVALQELKNECFLDLRRNCEVPTPNVPVELSKGSLRRPHSRCRRRAITKVYVVASNARPPSAVMPTRWLYVDITAVLRSLRQASARPASEVEPTSTATVSCYEAHQNFWVGSGRLAQRKTLRKACVDQSPSDAMLQACGQPWLMRLYTTYFGQLWLDAKHCVRLTPLTPPKIWACLIAGRVGCRSQLYSLRTPSVTPLCELDFQQKSNVVPWQANNVKVIFLLLGSNPEPSAANTGGHRFSHHMQTVDTF
ncbi:hypothetical protein PCANC_24722 [Puccinia coronata f. sp. avenae]|uniref:Uncharacterized protein n=1 Tax=Puccinia coronata f. sp. avenae TaxID=200324 RepID=A0A2N5S3L3_9BASI|nr:hypothetical protein PCANC_24722 [Puccinia coronata f. sp. avenae]